MKEYHKIQTVFLRDPKTNYKTLLQGQYALPEFEYLSKNSWLFTEKVDGTNIRISQSEGRLIVSGRTDNSSIPVFLLETIQARFQSSLLTQVFDTEDFCLYGEGYGVKIQKGGGNYKLDGTNFVLFDVRVGDWWLQRKDVVDVAFKLGIDVIPIIGEGSLEWMVKSVQIGIISRWGDFPAEGIVARPKTELYTRSGHRIITKIKAKDFQN